MLTADHPENFAKWKHFAGTDRAVGAIVISDLSGRARTQAGDHQGSQHHHRA